MCEPSFSRLSRRKIRVYCHLTGSWFNCIRRRPWKRIYSRSSLKNATIKHPEDTSALKSLLEKYDVNDENGWPWSVMVVDEAQALVNELTDFFPLRKSYETEDCFLCGAQRSGQYSWSDWNKNGLSTSGQNMDADRAYQGSAPRFDHCETTAYTSCEQAHYLPDGQTSTSIGVVTIL